MYYQAWLEIMKKYSEKQNTLSEERYLDRIAAALERGNELMGGIAPDVAVLAKSEQPAPIDLGIEPCSKCGYTPIMYGNNNNAQCADYWMCEHGHESIYGPYNDPRAIGWNAMVRKLKGEQAK